MPDHISYMTWFRRPAGLWWEQHVVASRGSCSACLRSLTVSHALPLSVTIAVLCAAVTHATWNAIAHGIKDQTLAFALIGVGGIVVAIPLVIVATAPRPDCWPYLAASIVI